MATLAAAAAWAEIMTRGMGDEKRFLLLGILISWGDSCLSSEASHFFLKEGGFGFAQPLFPQSQINHKNIFTNAQCDL